MQLHRRLLTLAGEARLPRRTVRLRLTLLYGTLFLACGALVLAITYGLVDRATRDSPVTFTLSDGRTITVGASEGGPAGGEEAETPGEEASVFGPAGLTPEEDFLSPEQVRALASQQHADQMRELLVQSGIALGVMAVVSVVLGWIVAGRVLRPLRTITATARDISATNLHERLALDGPDDELKELGDTFDDLLARLERSFEAQRRFVANASHELRPPLARQRTVAQVALDDPDATVESLRMAHERVLAAGAQQERLIEALLTLARGQTGFEKSEPFGLADLTGHVLLTRRAEAKRRGLELSEELAPATAAGDPRLVERLVANLVDNALCHNVAGGDVRVLTGTRSGHPVLSVANTGPVVPAADVDRLFEPFQRIGNGRTSHGEGLGLGLSIAKAIAKAHGATITAHPRPGGGLEIDVSFPVTEVGTVRAHAAPDRAHPALTGTANQSRRDRRSRAST